MANDQVGRIPGETLGLTIDDVMSKSEKDLERRVIYLQQSIIIRESGDPDLAIRRLQELIGTKQLKGTEAFDQVVNIWHNLGLCYDRKFQFRKAIVSIYLTNKECGFQEQRIHKSVEDHDREASAIWANCKTVPKSSNTPREAAILQRCH